ncbi:MAG: glycosyl transferase family 36 [Anaerolineae bacterium]|nr:glycosyl transferase family 36 [Anaerolineae bacterium]
MAQLQNQYGYFSDDGREYVITRADTPMPWINVISNGDYGFTISQAGSGYSWRTHASLNRITRWDQDLIRDEWGKYLYLRDADTGEFWSPTFQPCGAALEAYQVRHGMGYTVIESNQSGIVSEISYFAPLDAPCEIWLLRLTNHRETPRRLQIFSYLEWLLGAAPDWHREFHRTFIETEYDADHHALLATKVLWELPVESRSHWNRSWEYVAFHSVSLTPAGFDGDKRDFLGRHGHLSKPQALVSGQSCGNVGRWGDAIGSLQVALTLQPGETQEIAFTLGAAETRAEALPTCTRFQALGEVHTALDAARRYWRDLTERLVVETPDPALNLMANGWLQYQAISGRLFGRTAYYQTGGAYGFRDQLQDSLTWLLLGHPEKNLEQIQLHARHQYQDGVVLHWWHPLAETGQRSEYSDDLLWLPFVTIHYLRETGDFTCLDLDIPFYDGRSASLRDHCLRAFDLALERRSARGLPLILKADWNDGMNAVGVEGCGESVWMAHFLHYLLRAWAELPVCDAQTADRFLREADDLREAVNRHAWDGAWYWRATTDAGALVGSHQSRAGRIFLNAQTWSVIGGIADEVRGRQAMASAREHLYAEYGPLLLFPAFTQSDPHIGYLTRYAPGARENGGVYCHAACWAVLAERKMNGVEAAYRLWRSFCPPVRAANPDVYAGEPYVMPGNVAGPQAAVPGQAGWTWYTGSAGWYLRALVEGVLGIEAHLDGLHLNADLPDEWDQFRVRRIYRGATYDITVRRAVGNEVPHCLVNGATWQGERLPVGESGSVQRVEFSL